MRHEYADESHTPIAFISVNFEQKSHIVLIFVFMWDLVLCCVLAILFVIGFSINRYWSHGNVDARPAKTMVVLGSGTACFLNLFAGGHTSEMLALLHSLDPSLYTPMVIVSADTDKKSISRYMNENVRASLFLCLIIVCIRLYNQDDSS